MKNLIIKVLFISIIFYSCNNDEKLLSISEMKFVMWDVINADEWIKLKNANQSSDSIKKESNNFYNKIFDLHKITEQQFYNSYKFYQSHPIEMKILLDSIANYGTRKRDTLINQFK